MKRASSSLRKHKNDLGPFVKLHRKAKILSLDDLARRTGLSRSYLGDIEAGRKGVSLPAHTVSMLAQALGVEINEITKVMVRNDAEDPKKYAEYYRVLRSTVRAGQIARLLAEARQSILAAQTLISAGKDASKCLQRLGRTVESIDNTLAYRGKPPDGVRAGHDRGDDEKFFDGRLTGND